MLMVIGLLGGCSSPAKAGGYEIVKGKGVEVCEAYKENLNSFKPVIPMYCERLVNPSMTNFKKPQWKQLDVFKQSNVIKKIDLFFWRRDANPVYYFPVEEWKTWKGTNKQYAQAFKGYKADRNGRGFIGHYVSKLDINNDGVNEQVYLDNTCSSGAYGVLMLVLNDSQTEIDISKSQHVLQHSNRKEAGLGEFQPLLPGSSTGSPFTKLFGYNFNKVPDSLHHAFYDVFQFKKKTYFDLWWRKHHGLKGKPDNIAEQLQVFMTENNITKEICRYKFNYE